MGNALPGQEANLQEFLEEVASLAKKTDIDCCLGLSPGQHIQCPPNLIPQSASCDTYMYDYCGGQEDPKTNDPVCNCINSQIMNPGCFDVTCNDNPQAYKLSTQLDAIKAGCGGTYCQQVIESGSSKQFNFDKNAFSQACGNQPEAKGANPNPNGNAAGSTGGSGFLSSSNSSTSESNMAYLGGFSGSSCLCCSSCIFLIIAVILILYFVMKQKNEK
jgi:hypothetical protein